MAAVAPGRHEGVGPFEIAAEAHVIMASDAELLSLIVRAAAMAVTTIVAGHSIAGVIRIGMTGGTDIVVIAARIDLFVIDFVE